MPMFKRACVVLLLIAASACGSSDNGLTTPSGTYPNVAGNYSGSVTFTFITLGQSLTCPATTTVTQSGGPNVNIAPLSLTGSCISVFPSLPVGDGTITTTGSLGTINQNLALASCNGTYNAVASGGFFGSSLQFSLVYTALSGGCVSQVGNFTITGTLGR
jgi:hypothetical protein